MAVNAGRTLDDTGHYHHPAYDVLMDTPGLSVLSAKADDLMAWGLKHSLWMFPMATSCCGIEFMTANGARVDLDRMGTIVRPSPRHADVMVVAGTITTKMAPRVLKLWEQMPEPKWVIAMGSCAISGDFYRNLYSVVPGVDTFLPVDVYIPGCPPNPEALMHGLLRLREKIDLDRKGLPTQKEMRPEVMKATKPCLPRITDIGRNPALGHQQETSAFEATRLDSSEGLVIDAPAVPPMPAAPTAPDLDALLAAEFGVSAPDKLGPSVIPAARHVELAQKLKAMGYRQLVSVVASHWPAGIGRKGKDPAETEHFELTVALRTIGAGSRVASWTVRLAPGETIASLAQVFAGCDWQEREQYDLVGIKFAGHPDLRRLMMAENYKAHPLRKDFPIDSPDAPWR